MTPLRAFLPRVVQDHASTLWVVATLSVAAAWALPTSIQAGDAGEMATVMLRGGVPHPSGYPWMRILGGPARVLEHFGVSPVRAAAIPCAVAAILGWSALHRVARRWTSAGAATCAVLLAALSPVVLLHTFDVEVWGPLVGFAGGFVNLAARQRTPRPLLLGAGLGLVISHHLTGVLLLPLAVAAAAPPRGAGARSWLKAAGEGSLGTLLGLTPVLTLMLGDGEAWRWGDPRSWSGLVHHWTRVDYGVLSLSLHSDAIPPLVLLERAMQSIGRTLSAGLVHSAWLGSGLLLCVFVLGWRARSPALPSRRIVLGLGASAFASLVLFPLAHNIDPRAATGAWILERFDVLGLALLTPWVALAMHRIPTPAANRARVALVVLSGLVLLRQGLASAWHGLPSSDEIVQRYAIDLVQTPTPGRRAIVFGTDDHRTFPVLFVQRVLGFGPDVLYIDASLLAHRWYRDDLRRRFPGLPDGDKPVQLVNAMFKDPRLDDVELYVANVFSRPAQTLPLVPAGVLWRVLRHGERGHPIDILPAHREALDRYRRPPDWSAMPIDVEIMTGHPFSSDLLANYPERTADLAKGLRDTGFGVEAERLLQEALLSSPPSKH